jgi:FAD/FMN-containing dehydrogenase
MLRYLSYFHSASNVPSTNPRVIFMTTAQKLNARLRAALDGRMLARGDEGFAAAAGVAFAGDERMPLLIARPRNARDTAEVVRAAVETDTPLAVRGGGHSYARYGLIDDGIVLDVRGLGKLGFDIASRVGTAQGGVTTGAYTVAAADSGLATGFGDTASVGIAGLTLGGGIGFLSRRDGLTMDSLLSAELLLADGRIVTASETEHPDLFWAIRGGGGNFGVVISLRLRLCDTPVVTGGLMAFRADGDTAATLVAAATAAPDELSTMVNVMKAPPAPFLPPELHGRPIVVALVCHSGMPGAAASALAPLRAAGPLIADFVRTQPYPGMFGAGAEAAGMRASLRTGFAESFDADRANRAIELVGEAHTATAVVNLRVMGGAIGRVSVEATAFPHRDRAIMASVSAIDADPELAAAGSAWADSTAEQLAIAGTGYVNFVTAAGSEAARVAYPGTTLGRLIEAKRRYDPSNVFRSNLNISPDLGRIGSAEGML